MGFTELHSKCQLPAGMSVHTLTPYIDHRGYLTEVYRESWLPSSENTMIQWNFVKSYAGVLRGVHVHKKHTDYLILLEGKMFMGLHDIRVGSPTQGTSAFLTLTAAQPKAILTPPGILHGFYFEEDSLHFYGVNSYWSIKDELGCYWNDPDLKIAWPTHHAILSDRDQHAPSFKKLLEQLGPIYYQGN